MSRRRALRRCAAGRTNREAAGIRRPSDATSIIPNRSAAGYPALVGRQGDDRVWRTGDSRGVSPRSAAPDLAPRRLDRDRVRQVWAAGRRIPRSAAPDLAPGRFVHDPVR